VASYKNPSFQDRVAAARNAKQKAIDQLKAKPPMDEAIMKQRREAWESRESALLRDRTAKADAAQAAKREKALAKRTQIAEAEAAAALKAERLKPASEAEMKAARDARYAARQARRK
jgi:hypothetical protein